MFLGLFTLFNLISSIDGALTNIKWLPLFDNITALNEDDAPLWVAEPPYRGTWGILYSCTIALGLSLYINIPAATGTSMTIYMRKLKWMFIALIAPEVVLYAAWKEWYAARKICKRLNKLVCAMAFHQLLENH
ncbi:hypothetical protein FPQ18DRAFT_412311 [Pyronema domesticum]|nr:hypothetical protein FPQ18DRAFT_412311 [Pyronema domesticum]